VRLHISHIFKEQKNVRLHIFKEQKCAMYKCANVRLPNPGAAIQTQLPDLRHQKSLPFFQEKNLNINFNNFKNNKFLKTSFQNFLKTKLDEKNCLKFCYLAATCVQGGCSNRTDL